MTAMPIEAPMMMFCPLIAYGEQIAEMGPGTMLGERASLEGGVRTATLRAITPCRVAVIPPGFLGEPADLG